MKKKFAVCFSGYPRFVKKTFETIKENFLNGLGDYDIYANLQWNKDWKTTQIHHAFNDTFEDDELQDFIDIYTPLNLQKIQVNNPFVFDVSNYNVLSTDPHLSQCDLELCRDIYYRTKSQYQGIADCIKIIDDVNDYDYFVRVRTDLIFEKKLNFENFESDVIINQSGYCAGWDRPFCDWFFITPRHQLQFYDDISKVEEHHKNGIVAMHSLIESIGNPYGIKHQEFNIGVPLSTNYLGELLKKRK